VEIRPRLLQVFHEGEFEAVGDDKSRRVNVRIIASTNRDLKSAVRGTVPRGPLLPAERVSNRGAAVARAQ